MSTQAGSIIDSAFREANLIPIGRAPTTFEYAEALQVLNRYINGMLGVEIGEYLMDWPVPPTRTAPEPARWPLGPQDDALPADVWPYVPNNVRLVVNLTQDTTVYFPWQPNDGARIGFANVNSGAFNLTCNGNGRRINNATTQVLTPASTAPAFWFYRADEGRWLSVSPLALTTDFLFLPSEFDDMLSAGLSIRLARRFGQDARAESIETERRGLRRLRARYHQEMPIRGSFTPQMLSLQAFPTGYIVREGLM